MPTLNFVMPHWGYWCGLLLFPPLAAWLYRRERRRGQKPGVNLGVAYLFLIAGGYAGIHRLYLGTRWALLVFVPLFLAILYCNDIERDARDGISKARQEERFASRELNLAAGRQDGGGATAAQDLATLQADAQRARSTLDAAEAQHQQIRRLTRALAWLLLGLLAVEAIRMPRLVARARAAEQARRTAAGETAHIEFPHQAEYPEWVAKLPHDGVLVRFIRTVDLLSRSVGEFVAYWPVIAVFAYYYEVIARYVFNSPTNWVHESMFLMFGMQYMLSGAYALRDDAHVRVDLIYSHLSPRGQAFANVVASVFFLIFTCTMLWTGTRFALDAINVGEVSFTEWGIQYWPVKLTIPIGAALIILQGLAGLARDLMILANRGAR